MADIADAIAAGLARREAELAQEQSVYGLDVHDEVRFHPYLARALRESGYGAWPERRYPAARATRRKSEGARCDLVITREELDLREPDVEGTLFDSPDATPLDEALWIEVKLVRQFTDEGPNARYSAQLLRPPALDLVKLAADGAILHAALLLILFTSTDEIADHDLRAWEERALAAETPIGLPCIRRIAIADRFGNARCTIALYPLMRR